jgi:hypothetical protein
MTDDLRTRIAAAACGATSAGKLFPWNTLSEPQKDAWREMADAVIDVLLEDPNVEIRGSWQGARLKTDHLPPIPQELATGMWERMAGRDDD